jgi:hypothetical protein
MGSPLNILDVLNSIQAQQPAAGVDPGLPSPGGAPATPGAGMGSLGTVLARLRTNGSRTKAILGGGANTRPAPSKVGALAQGLMQGLAASADFDRQQAAQQRLADLFAYNKSKDERDYAFRRERAAATDSARAARTRAAEGGWRGKEPDPLVTEQRRVRLLKEDPDFKRLQDDDDEGIPTRKLPPEQRKALEDKVAARRKEIWSMKPGRGAPAAANVPDDDLTDDGDGTPPAAAAPTATAPAPAAPAPRAPAAAAPEPQLAPDGKYYVKQNGKWFMVEGDE